MKKLLNPKLARQEAVVIEFSSSEETGIVKQGSKGKGKTTANPSPSSQPANTKRL